MSCNYEQIISFNNVLSDTLIILTGEFLDGRRGINCTSN